MAYRSDVEALEARYAALDAEVLERGRVRDEVARMLAEARAREVSDAYVADLDAGGPSRRRRRRLVRLALALVTAVVAIAGAVGIRAGCRHSTDRSSDRSAIYLVFSVFTGEMCACTTTACAVRVSDEMTKWGSAMAQPGESGVEKMSEEEIQRFTKLGMRMGKCMQSAMAPGT